MQIKSKYKIARRLGPIYEKTQTQKFASRMASKKIKKGFGPRSDFGKALIEKQRARFSYNVNERQFSKYVMNALAVKHKKPEDALYHTLEKRLDNVVYRLGFAPTRLSARQAVSHGHISVNGKRVDVPSYEVSIKDKVSIMSSRRKSKNFSNLGESLKEKNVPNWLKMDLSKLEGVVLGEPRFNQIEVEFDVSAILDFYRR